MAGWMATASCHKVVLHHFFSHAQNSNKLTARCPIMLKNHDVNAPCPL